MGLEAPEAGRGRGVGELEVPVEREACRSQLIEETDDACIDRVTGRADDFFEPSAVVCGAVPEVAPLAVGSVGEADAT